MRGRRSNREERDFEPLIGKSYTYLMNNFHKFSKSKRFQLALELIKKAMPSDVNMKGEGFDTNVYNIITQLQRDFQKDSSPSLVLDSRDGVDKG